MSTGPRLTDQTQESFQRAVLPLRDETFDLFGVVCTPGVCYVPLGPPTEPAMPAHLPDLPAACSAGELQAALAR